MAPEATDKQDLKGAPGDTRRGLSVEFLITKLMQDLGVLKGETVHDIEPRIREKGENRCCPRDKQMGAAYVDVIEDPNAGVSNLMLSYSWQYQVSEIVSALRSYCDKHNMEKQSTRVWICCFCVNQHRVKEIAKVEVDQFMSTFGDRVRSTHRVVGLLSPWQSPVYVTRVWCLFEAFKAHQWNNVELDFLFPEAEAAKFQESLRTTGGDAVWEALSNIKVQEADASVPEDKQRILDMIETEVGFDSLNKVMKEQLCKWFVATAKDTEVKDASGNFAPEICVNIAELMTRLGDNEACIQFLQKSVHTCESLQLENEHVAMLLLRLGRAHGTKGDQDTSRELSEKALAMAKSVRGNDEHVSLTEAECLRTLAAIKRKRGDLRGSFELYKKALEAYHAHKGENGRLGVDAGWILLNLGIVQAAMLQEKGAWTQEDLQGAEDDFSYFGQAWQVYEEHGMTSKPAAAWVLRNRGVSYIREEKYVEAKADFDKAKKIYVDLHNTHTENYAELLKSEGILHLRQKEEQLAVRCFEEARKIFMDLVGPQMALATSMMDLAHLYVVREDLGAFQEAYNLARQVQTADHCVSMEEFEGRRQKFLNSGTIRNALTATAPIKAAPAEGFADILKSTLSTELVNWRLLQEILAKLDLNERTCEELLAAAIHDGFAKQEAQDKPYLVNVDGFLKWLTSE